MRNRNRAAVYCRAIPAGCGNGPAGAMEIHAHYTVDADDGTLIYVRKFGLRIADDETPDGRHQWLREQVFVGRPAPG